MKECFFFRKDDVVLSTQGLRCKKQMPFDVTCTRIKGHLGPHVTCRIICGQCNFEPIGISIEDPQTIKLKFKKQ